MKTKSITLGKEYKVGLPNYSNITVSMYETFEFGENEEPTEETYLQIWDKINRHLQQQTDGVTDPSWIHTQELKNSYKTVIKTPKGE